MKKSTLALYFAWVIALFGVFLSLYFGEVLHVEPCRLCWYQRLGLFPLAYLLGVAAYHDDQRLVRYAFPLALFGGIFALYQTLTLHFPALHHPLLCSNAEYCSIPVFTLFGFLSFPLLSFLGFASISLLLVYSIKN